MATFAGKQSMLDAALGDYARKGFSLREPDDHITELLYNGKVIARFNQTKWTIPIIHEGCQNYLNNLARRS